MFLRIRDRYLLCRFDWKENPEKRVKIMEKIIHELKVELAYLCVGEMKINKQLEL